MDNIKCIGCGIDIQTIDSKIDGYLPEKALLSKKDNDVLCQRCFKIRHYNEYSRSQKTANDFLDILKSIKKDSLIVKIVDIFDLSGSFIMDFEKLVKSKDILLIANKLDLLPRSKKHLRLEHYVRRYTKSKGLNVLDVLLMSSTNNWYIDEAIDKIIQYSKNRDVYIVGCANVGKSTFINKLLKNYTDVSEDVITSSKLPGTTLDLIEIPFNNKYIVDTPGVINTKSITTYLNESLKYCVPQKEIKPIVYQTDINNSFVIEKFAHLDFIEGEKQSFVFNFARAINIHRCKTDNIDNIFLRDDLFNYPTKEEDLGSYITKEFKINSSKDNKKELVIAGLGFISITNKCIINITYNKKINVFLREAIL